MGEAVASPSILIVDDTIENLRLLTTMLTEQGYEVRPVTSPKHALQALAHAPPELILLDVNMPEMDGFEVCRRVREMGLGDVPVIFLTALTDVSDKVKAFDAGGVDFISKPFQLGEVLARVKTHLALRQARMTLQHTNEHLLEVEKLRDDLVHMIVHDMRSPLTTLIASLRFVVDDNVGKLDAQSADDLQAAIRSAESLNRMANELLDLRRLEMEQLPLDRKTTDFVKLAVDVQRSMKRLDRARTIDVEAPAPVEADCDEAVVRRVLENLVGNAIRHTPAGGCIRICVMTREDRVRVEVRDEGRGVPPEARAKIFERYGALAARHEGSFHSVGLGLAFSKLAVQAHGGGIGVEDGVPVGATFWFEIPR